MPTTAKILKGGGHQVTNTAGTNERFAERAVCREGGVRSWKRWPLGKMGRFYDLSFKFPSSHRYEYRSGRASPTSTLRCARTPTSLDLGHL